MLEDAKEQKKFLDLFTKVKKVFTSDIYILNCSDIYPGEKSSLNLSGYFKLIISEDYIELLKKAFRNNAGEIQTRISIENIDDFKKGLNEYKSYETDNEKSLFDEKINSMVTKFSEMKRENIIWMKFKLSDNETENQELLDKFFTDKLIVELHDPKNECPKVMIGSSFLPYVTMKNVNDLYCSISKYATLENEIIYSLKFLFIFSHFEMYCHYFYI